MRAGTAILLIIPRAGDDGPAPSTRSTVGGPCRDRGVPASPLRGGCSATRAAEQSAGGRFAADRLKPAQVLARLADSVRPRSCYRPDDTAGAALAGPQTAFSGPVWPICCLARRGSVWHGPLPWRRPRPQTCRLPRRTPHQASDGSARRKRAGFRSTWQPSLFAATAGAGRRTTVGMVQVGQAVLAASAARPWSAGWSGWQRWRWPARQCRRCQSSGTAASRRRPASSQRPGGAFGDMSHGRQAGQFGQRGAQS